MPNRTFKYLFVYKRLHFLSLEINQLHDDYTFQKHDEKTTVYRDQCFQEFGPCMYSLLTLACGGGGGERQAKVLTKNLAIFFLFPCK
jgi:hypothetical protein